MSVSLIARDVARGIAVVAIACLAGCGTEPSGDAEAVAPAPVVIDGTSRRYAPPGLTITQPTGWSVLEGAELAAFAKENWMLGVRAVAGADAEVVAELEAVYDEWQEPVDAVFAFFERQPAPGGANNAIQCYREQVGPEVRLAEDYIYQLKQDLRRTMMGATFGGSATERVDGRDFELLLVDWKLPGSSTQWRYLVRLEGSTALLFLLTAQDGQQAEFLTGVLNTVAFE